MTRYDAFPTVVTASRQVTLAQQRRSAVTCWTLESKGHAIFACPLSFSMLKHITLA